MSLDILLLNTLMCATLLEQNIIIDTGERVWMISNKENVKVLILFNEEKFTIRWSKYIYSCFYNWKEA